MICKNKKSRHREGPGGRGDPVPKTDGVTALIVEGWIAAPPKRELAMTQKERAVHAVAHLSFRIIAGEAFLQPCGEQVDGQTHAKEEQGQCRINLDRAIDDAVDTLGDTEDFFNGD